MELGLYPVDRSKSLHWISACMPVFISTNWVGFPSVLTGNDNLRVLFQFVLQIHFVTYTSPLASQIFKSYVMKIIILSFIYHSSKFGGINLGDILVDNPLKID